MPVPADRPPLRTPARLQALARTGLGAVADETFDRFAAMVRTVLGVPVVLVSLVEADRQILPGACGLGDPWARRRETPLSHSFARQVVTTAEPLVVTDARADPRVRGNPAIEELGTIGYAGMPLTDADGQVLGSLAAIDHRPRHWTEAEIGLLADLAAACSDSLRLRIAGDLARRLPDRARVLEERPAGRDDGVARLHDLLARHAGAAPEELADLVLRHAAGAAHQDDVALLVVATPGPLRLPFTADLDGAAIRSTARRLLTGRQAPDLIDDTLVVITELVQNAVEHSGAGGDLVLTTRADGVLVEVLDGSPEQPTMLPPDPRRVGGRGLLLVAALAQDWGSRPVGAGKIVWARLPATPARESQQTPSFAGPSAGELPGHPHPRTR